ncbi:hypothetical protein Vadar_026276 [Vaccinium darrowii]|uniref:Uncharacterized protein n=1 Tax=Vaccinium darrowii TaxID=229202 RepID=A0ACB7Y2L7_9ERIC|nr:hypothetical protein Vadar_026276 [Vaccinium darrowii]
MMVRLRERFRAFFNNRWLVLVAAMWIQTWAGTGYLFGSISPVVKSSLNYNQKQIARLGVAKDLGGSIGFLAGCLCEVLPLWGALLVGALHNFVGYGWVWLIVTGRAPALPLWAMCTLIFVGGNGETYFNTASLVACVQNFPKSRGSVVGILKGYVGLGGAILTQLFAVIHTPDRAALIFMVAIGPAMVIIPLMFIVRPVECQKQDRSSDSTSSSFIYSVCLLLAAYLMAVMLLEDLFDLSHTVIIIFTVGLVILLVVPVMIPISLSFLPEVSDTVEVSLLPDLDKHEANKSEHDTNEVLFSEVEDELHKEVDMPPALEGAVRIRKRKGPHRGEDFTLTQALIKVDFWLIFFSLLLGTGSGLTVMDNLGQLSQSLGYDNTHIFVSLISIWNFLGRVGGGYFSEIIVRDYAYPRPVAMAASQLIMAVGHFVLAMGWPEAMYIGTLLIGLSYGAHWAIFPAAASDLFGLKKFGALYNFLALATPAGSLVFSGLIASSIYDSEAEKQHHHPHHQKDLGSIFIGSFVVDEPPRCDGAICFFLTLMIMSGLCIIAVVLSMVLVYRTKVVYAQLYGKSRT